MFFYRRRQPGANFDCFSIGEGSREPLAIGERSDVRALEYDRFGAVVYEEAGNGTRSHRTYDATTRRVDTIEAGDFQNVHHTFDAVGQLTDLVNDVSSRRTDRYGGRVTQHFEYDLLERLTSASGTWDRPEGGTDRYSLAYQYDDLHNITRKTQTHEVLTRGNSHPIPQHGTTYDLAYTYGGSRPHAPSRIGTATFTYDDNGNQVARDDSPANRRRRTEWDEESLPRAITVVGHRTEFVYDAAGSRVAKIGAQGETVYVNPTWTVRNGTIATKHVYVGGRRVASKILPGVAPSSDDPDLVAGMLGRWYEHRSDSGNEHANNTTMNPHYRVPSSMPTNGTPESNFVYFYHGDMIGSVSYVTDQDGELFEHNQFFASGEQWVSQNSNSERLPFLYTATEHDQETDLYAFGVRMYDPREQVWLSPDPGLPMFLGGGGPNGGTVFQPRTLGLFSFAFNNPVMFDDPTGFDSGRTYTPSEANMSLSPEDESAGMTHDRGSEVVAPTSSSSSSPNRDRGNPAGLRRGNVSDDYVRDTETFRSAIEGSGLAAVADAIASPGVDSSSAGYGDALLEGVVGLANLALMTSVPPNPFGDSPSIDVSGGDIRDALGVSGIDTSNDSYRYGSYAGTGTFFVASLFAGGGGGGNVVYRGLAAGENPAAGLVARAPEAANNVVQHVAGLRASQWISTTRSLEVAIQRFGQHGVVRIDLSRVPGTIVDLTRGIPGLSGSTMLSRWAIKMEEVLVQGRIPAEAITRIR